MKKKEIRETGAKLAIINSIRVVIGQILITQREVLILKLWEKVELMDILIRRMEAQVMEKVPKEPKMIQFGLEMIGVEVISGTTQPGKGILM